MALFETVVSTATPYLGPAAEKFIKRQISGHLSVDESQLGPQHLEELSNWCYTSGKLIMPDDQAKEFAAKVKALK